MRRWPNVGLLLGQRRGRWAISKPTLDQRLMVAGYTHSKQATQKTRSSDTMLGYCCNNVADGGPTLTQHWVNVSCWQGKLIFCFKLWTMHSMSVSGFSCTPVACNVRGALWVQNCPAARTQWTTPLQL